VKNWFQSLLSNGSTCTATTRAGTKRVVETATLTAALTNAFAAPPVPSSLKISDVPDAPVPFFYPALGSATLKKHAAAAAAARGGYPGYTVGKPSAVGEGALQGGGPGTVVFFRNYASSRQRQPPLRVPAASVAPGLPSAFIQPMPAQTNRPEELWSETVLCLPIPHDDDDKVGLYELNPVDP
jgi:hypothetical protein